MKENTTIESAVDIEAARQHLKAILRSAWRVSAATDALIAQEKGQIADKLKDDNILRELLLETCESHSSNIMDEMDELIKLLGFKAHGSLFSDERRTSIEAQPV